MLTIYEHVQTADGYRLVVRVPNTTPEQLASIGGSATALPVTETQTATDPETGEESTVEVVVGYDALHTTLWAADEPEDRQRAEARALIEHALAVAAEPAPDPVTPSGTEL